MVSSGFRFQNQLARPNNIFKRCRR